MSPAPHDKILLVEGRDDREVIFQFCNHHGIDNRALFTIKDKDGLDSLLDDLRLRVRTGVSALGVVVDADADPRVRWQQLAHRSKAAVHTWLAWQEEPGTALGQAITKRDLDSTRDPAPAFRAWLLALFGLEAPRA